MRRGLDEDEREVALTEKPCGETLMVHGYAEASLSILGVAASASGYLVAAFIGGGRGGQKSPGLVIYRGRSPD